MNSPYSLPVEQENLYSDQINRISKQQSWLTAEVAVSGAAVIGSFALALNQRDHSFMYPALVFGSLYLTGVIAAAYLSRKLDKIRNKATPPGRMYDQEEHHLKRIRERKKKGQI